MRRLLQSALLVLLAAGCARAGDLVEHIAATVNGQVVLSSEVQTELAYSCLMERSQCSRSPAARTAAIQRLIDRALVRQQMQQSKMPLASEEEVSAKLEELQTQLLHASAAPGESWPHLLGRFQLSEADVRSRVRAELNELRFIDARFRPAVYVSPSSIQHYFDQQLLPKLPKNAPAPELSSVEPQIREVLTQQAISRDFSDWLAALRQQSDIEVR